MTAKRTFTDPAICTVCGDTHQMWLTSLERYVPCTHCPTPCQKCRQGGRGPYCEHTPCSCSCHTAQTGTPAGAKGVAKLPVSCTPMPVRRFKVFDTREEDNGRSILRSTNPELGEAQSGDILELEVPVGTPTVEYKIIRQQDQTIYVRRRTHGGQ